jgi:UDP-glucose 4-epimerase
MRILVVGGAGYIGSHAVRRLLQAGHDAVVFDNLSLGHAAAVPDGLLVVGDLADRAALLGVMQGGGIDAVMHFAAFASVPESVADPAKYYRNNLAGTLNLLDSMREAGVASLVFSSTCAVYGECEGGVLREDSPTRPINPYGATKLACERMIADYGHAYGLTSGTLRYFNACGAAGDGSIGEDHRPETHLIPLALQVALGQREYVAVCGTDYPTPDGTCIRDYVHVEDLADAHLDLLERVAAGEGGTYNLGTGIGFSVRQVVEAARRVTGHPIPVVEYPRRPGDPPRLVASPLALGRDQGWRPRFTDIEAIVETAWRWHSAHPLGYGGPDAPGMAAAPGVGAIALDCLREAGATP